MEKLLYEITDPEEGVQLLHSEAHLLRIANLMNVHAMYQRGSNLLQLREVIQVFSDGRFRVRSGRQVAIAEKFHNDELQVDAVARALKEELGVVGINTENITVLLGNVTTKNSQSYLGLLSEYRVTYYLYCMEEKYFCPSGYVETQKDKSTYFAWERV